MRHVGILGGTFDPIHEGHLSLARAALRQGELDEVVLMPMARPAHREAQADIENRLCMCRLAAEGEKDITVSPIGAAPSMQYTADTLPLLTRQYPDARFTFILGADKLLSLPYWRGADKLFETCDFLCFPRPGISPEDALERARAFGASVTLMPSIVSPYSSTLVRSRTAAYEDAPGVPGRVLCHMAENGLYQTDFLPRLKTMMNPHRFRHTLGVRKEAVRLAYLHGAPVQKAALAGLLHDCAKGMSQPQLAQIAEKEHLVQDEAMLQSGAMLHGPVGAYVAQKQFGIRDEDVLNAIRSHTIGRPGMTLLELVIFVADATEEGRENYKGLHEIRALSNISLPGAALRSMELTEEYLRENNRPFFNIGRETMAYLREISKESESYDHPTL